MILITGATGNVGVPLVQALVAAGQHIRAFVTDVGDAKAKLGDRVELAPGSFADVASVDAALVGVERVYLLAPAGPDEPTWRRRSSTGRSAPASRASSIIRSRARRTRRTRSGAGTAPASVA